MRKPSLRQFESLEPRRMMAADLDLPAIPESVTTETGEDTVRVIVQLANQNVMEQTVAEFPEDVSVLRTMKHSPIVVLNLPESHLEQLHDVPNVVSVTHDIPHKPTLESATIMSQALHATRYQGFDGTNTTIAILDTGIDDEHPFFGPVNNPNLRNRIIAERCYSNPQDATQTSLCPNGQPTDTDASVRNVTACYDGFEFICNHGTHVAGIAAGSVDWDSTAPANGVAPNADIISMQVFTRFEDPELCGDSSACVLAYQSDQIAALDELNDLALANPDWNIVAANMSLGGGKYETACDNSPLKPAIDALLANGVATVISAGNDSHMGSVGHPACVSSAYTVGSIQDDFNLSGFTNRGPLLDVFAPGSDIESSVLGGFDSFNGTSMAAPHVAGALAQMRQAFPDRPITELMDVLKNTGQPIQYDSLDPNGTPIVATTPLIQMIDAIASYGDDHANTIDVFSTPMLSSERGDGLFGIPTLGRLETWGDVDTFRFTAEAGTQIQISTSGRLPLGNLTLFWLDRSTVLRSADLLTGMSFIVPDRGEYYLQIDGNFNNFPLFIGDYGIFLNHNDDHGRNAVFATPINRDAPVSGQLEVLGNEDWFSFSAIAGEELVLETTGLTFERITLYASDGVTPLAFADGSLGTEARLEFTAASNDTYYARVTASETGDYELRLFDDPGDPGDPDDQLAEANVANVGFGLGGAISEPTDVDMFFFNVSDGETVGFDLDISVPGLDSVLRLFDGAGNQININDNGPGPLPEFSADESYIEHTFNDAGTYYIGVSSSENVSYDPLTGDGDVAGTTVGNYSLLLHEIANSPNADFNRDGNLDGADIDALVANIALGPVDPFTFDLTGDGIVDLADRDAWLAEAGAAHLPSGNPYLLGDATLDGVVDVSDFNAWNTYKFTNEAAWTRGDFNADGSVDVPDFNTWNERKFTSADSNQLRAGRPSIDLTAPADANRRSPLSTAFDPNESLDKPDQRLNSRILRRGSQRPMTSLIAHRRWDTEDASDAPSREELSDLVLSIWG